MLGIDSTFMPTLLPILRAPPFPGIASHVAQVSEVRAGGRGLPASATSDAAPLIDALRAERVGGSFWAPLPPAFAGRVTLLRPRTPGESRTMAEEALRDAAPAGILALLPSAPWARAAQRRLAARGILSTIGDVDPWPLLSPDTLLLAHGDDELVLLTEIAGGRARVRSAGRFAPAAPDHSPTIERRTIAALLDDTVYRDPFTGRPAGVLQTIALLGTWRRLIDANRGVAVAVGRAVGTRR